MVQLVQQCLSTKGKPKNQQWFSPKACVSRLLFSTRQNPRDVGSNAGEAGAGAGRQTATFPLNRRPREAAPDLRWVFGAQMIQLTKNPSQVCLAAWVFS